MGATAVLRFARHATGSVVALVPQIDVRDFDYAGERADFDCDRKARLRRAVEAATAETRARVVVHVGQDAADLQQLRDTLPATAVQEVRGQVDQLALALALPRSQGGRPAGAPADSPNRCMDHSLALAGTAHVGGSLGMHWRRCSLKAAPSGDCSRRRPRCACCRRGARAPR